MNLLLLRNLLRIDAHSVAHSCNIKIEELIELEKIDFTQLRFSISLNDVCKYYSSVVGINVNTLKFCVLQGEQPKYIIPTFRIINKIFFKIGSLFLNGNSISPKSITPL